MSPRSFIEFFKSPPGRLLVFSVILVGLLVVISRRAAHKDGVPTLVRPGQDDSKPQLIESETRAMEPFRPPSPRPEPPPPPPAAAATPLARRTEPPAAQVQESVLTPISLATDMGQGEAELQPLPNAPIGRLIACETVITVDSSRLQTPIIGLTTEDVYYAGSLVIPAGTEVHGTAQSDQAARDRIASGTTWTLVWQEGDQLRLRAMALDREFEHSGEQSGWGITDGSAGLRGRLVKSDELAEAKLFAAAFLRGAAGALTEKETTLLGTIDSRSLNNAPLKGAEDVLGVYAQRTLDSIERELFFVRVPSGKQFYLYVLEPIVLARRGRPTEDPPGPGNP